MGENYFASSRTLDQHIVQIREVAEKQLAAYSFAFSASMRRMRLKSMRG